MADVTTNVIRALDKDTLNNTSKNRNPTPAVSTVEEVNTSKKSMTVDKTVKSEAPAPGRGTTTTSTTSSSTTTKLGLTGQTSSTGPTSNSSSSSGAPRGSPPTQMKAAPGNVATASPKKPDSKGNSPQSKSSADPHTATKSSLQPAQQQQLHSSAKSSPKKNPWNRNPSANAPPAAGGEGKKSQVEGSSEPKPSGKPASEESSPLQKDPSRSIKIPHNEVQLLGYLSQCRSVHHSLYVQITSSLSCVCVWCVLLYRACGLVMARPFSTTYIILLLLEVLCIMLGNATTMWYYQGHMIHMHGLKIQSLPGGGHGGIFHYFSVVSK